jgi:hypothetical protein
LDLVGKGAGDSGSVDFGFGEDAFDSPYTQMLLDPGGKGVCSSY